MISFCWQFTTSFTSKLRKKERNSKSDVIYLNSRMVRKISVKNFVSKLNWAWSFILDPYLSQILMNWSSLKNAFIKNFTLWIKSQSFFYNQNLKSDQFSSSYKSYQFNIWRYIVIDVIWKEPLCVWCLVNDYSIYVCDVLSKIQ